jgi:hypothetical protein
MAAAGIGRVASCHLDDDDFASLRCQSYGLSVCSPNGVNSYHSGRTSAAAVFASGDSALSVGRFVGAECPLAFRLE